MKRFLVIGCGGSGGATLAYLMDQLRSDLAAHGVPALPRGWQFVHLDVPSSPEPGPEGVANVAAQGGTYLGTGPRDAVYRTLDRAVRQRFAERRAAHALSTWAPRDPEAVSTPISVGAGQYRAVGRMITLSRASEILRVMRGAWEELFRNETASELGRLGSSGGRVPGLGSYDDGTPVVFVVSSMAGGAGASMALDVCRLLSLVPGVDPNLVGVFMAAPDIFDAIPEAGRTGVRPNALAMLGEIVAAQAGSATEHDHEVLAALGLPGGQGSRLPFSRVFPVGRFAGVDRTLFGSGRPEAVYRGLGRGLAGMMMSGTATAEFVAYDLGNEGAPAIDRDLLGWGSDRAPLYWGSYGFASLSMGRERYAEYAAQRLASGCVQRLLDGHLQPGNAMSGSDQITALLDAQWRETCPRAGLPSATAGATDEQEVGAWITQRAFPRPMVEASARGVVDREIRPYVPDPTGQQARQWEPALRGRLGERRDPLLEACASEAAALAHRWHSELRARIEEVVVDACVRLGLGYASGLVERIAGHVRQVAAPGAGRLSQYAPDDVAALPPASAGALDRLPNGVVTEGHALVQSLLEGYQEQVRTHLYAAVSALAQQLLDDLAEDVLRPLTDALGAAQETLLRGRSAPVTDLGLARLETDQCSAWPTDRDERVPARFDQADNEVLLTTSADFGRQYQADVRRAVPVGSPSSAGFDAARDEVVGQILAGVWASVDADHAPGTPLEVRAPWRSRVFAVEPGTGRPLVPSRARYDLHLRPAELLARARRFVARRGESFDVFCRLSITDYVRGGGSEGSVSELEVADRRRIVVEKFTETLALARPLVSVDATALQTVHEGAQIAYRYKFSEVPFAGLGVADELLRVLAANTMIDAASSSTLERALGDSRGVTRIDVFGSYPNYSPLVFDAVVTPVAEQWARTAEMGREAFWQWRRSRPLPAALPMGSAERRAMVAGWFVGQVVGRIRLPDRPFNDPVRVWDGPVGGVDGLGTEGEWLDFPHPLLTPPGRFLAGFDWLPAVLESVLLAIAKAQDAPAMASLAPYRALRCLHDDTSQEPVGGIYVLASREILDDWLASGRVPPGGASRVPGADVASTRAERAAAAIEWLGPVREVARGLLADAPGREAGTRRARADRTPLLRDLAVDVNEVLPELADLIGELASTEADQGASRDVVF